MKNKFITKGLETIIYAKRPDGEILEIIIDTYDLEKVSKFPNSWTVVISRGKYIVRGIYRVDGKKKQIPLKRFIMQDEPNTSEKIIYNINGNGLDNRRVNLATNHEPEKLKKQNRYEINNEIVTIFLNRKEDKDLEAYIDKDDIQRVISYGTWFGEYHKDLKDYTVQNVTYTMRNGKKYREKLSLQNLIMNNYDGYIIKHKNSNRLDNRKENLILYKDEISNKYVVDGDITRIYLKNKDETYETIIDTEDLERVKSLGYTLHRSQGEGLPYCIYKKEGKTKYLHRFILNLEEGDNYVVDHKNHNTLDNRKNNLNRVTVYQNQQNRLGARKNSKSRIRGVSWDSRNSDWVVVVKGQYFGRFKDKSQAENLAKEKIKELMPYTEEVK